MITVKLQTIIRKAIIDLWGEKATEEVKLDFPPTVTMGDFAFGCFELAKSLKKSPVIIAEELAEKIGNEGNDVLIEKIRAEGPYVNFKINNEILFGDIYKVAVKGADNSGVVKEEREHTLGEYKSNNKKTKRKIMLEYLSPNTNKPLHLGHLRNGALGMATANLLQVNGNEVIKTILINDRGVHICKSMLAWQLFGNGETPESSGMKGDYLVGKYYVKFSEEAEKNPELEEQAQEMLQKWEEGDEEVLKLWKMMNEWVLNGFEESFKRFGFEFDVIYKESETYKLGKGIIEDGFKKGIFKKNKKGAIIFELSKEFGQDKNGANKKITLLRGDGTGLYITQDIGTAIKRAEDYQVDELIYVVASEQDYYFKTFFETLRVLGYDWAENNYHLSYGMVYLPDGRMKSREGKVVDADDLLTEVSELAKRGIKERRENGSLTKSELNRRAKVIALGAIKFYLLKVNPKQDITFNAQESLSFEGFTGPYCQYAYARGAKLLRDAGVNLEEVEEIDFSQLGSEEELEVAKKILESEEKIKSAGEQKNPSLLAVHIFELAKAFNQFYHSETVLKAEEEIKLARLTLVQAFLKTIKKELNLLGIDVLEEM